MGFRHCAAVGGRTRLTSSTALHRMSMPATMAKRRVGAATSDEDAVSAQQKAALPCRLCARTALTAAAFCTGTGPTTSAPDLAHPHHICAGTGLTRPACTRG